MSDHGWYTVASLAHDLTVPMYVDQLSEEEDGETSLDNELDEQPSASVLSPDDTDIEMRTGNIICIES